MKRKNAAAVALGRKGGMKGGPARAASLTPEQRSQSARNAVTARWAKAKTRTASATKKGGVINTSKESIDQKRLNKTTSSNAIDASNSALVKLLNRLKTTVDPEEIRQLSDQIERVVFHKQFTNA
jgi:hypothetical protein